ncbi:MAG: undecaprenyl/decaprenyl-phosphate alpha-N-acetylglucosaminyl 1-phosphate transferase [Anaerolineaceae bacterium]|nr:undecaprenyl/decaprenyl-phosphate alpha-N-acetylglucosaminyl 1-phosphate transferase [Anaerolineaceae bacterium]
MTLFEIGAFATVFFLALIVSLATIPLAIHLSYRWGILSTPGGRRHEQAPVPKLGGLAIFLGFTVAALAAQALPVERFDSLEVVRLVGLLLGGAFVFLIGFLDDLFELNYFWLFLGQILASAIAIGFQIIIEYFNNPITGSQTDAWPYAVTVALTMFWLILMMNTVNFLDGLDGLTSGIAIIAGLLLFINSAFRLMPAQTSVSLLPLAMVGACLGFLIFNFHPSRVFLGGSAVYLGYLIGALSIIGGAKMATILLVMGLPLMDLAWQAFSRLIRGRNPFQGDRGHLHFRLLDSNRMSHRQIVLSYYAFCAFFGGLTLVLESQLYKFIAFGVMLVLISIGFAIVARWRRNQNGSSGTTSSSA